MEQAPRTPIQSVVLVLALLTGPSAAAQGFDRSVFIHDLVPTIRDLVATVDEMHGEGRPISAEMQATLDRSGDIRVRESGDDVILSVASDVLFAFDSAELSPQAQRSLSDVAEVILRAPEGQVLVVGHTDSKGADTYNLALSERRAKSVANFLTGLKVASDRLQTEGRGKAEPVAENEINGRDNPEGRAQNRRVEFILPKSMLQGS